MGVPSVRQPPRALATQALMQLEFKSGPDKGTIMKVLSANVIIGRAPECDIVIGNDPQCSRQHVRLEVTPYGVVVHALNPENPPLVNGRPAHAEQAPFGSIITVGRTQLSIQSPGGSNTDSLRGAPHSSHLPNSTQRPKKAQKSSPLLKFVIVLAGLGLLLWFMDDEKKATKETIVGSEAQIVESVQKMEQTLAEQEKTDRILGKNTPQYAEARSHFISGFRDFEKGQYERSQGFFQACLIIFPSHNGCRRYLDLSRKKLDELINYHSVLGKTYTEKQQWEACASAYKNAMALLKDPSNPRFREAKIGRETCIRQMRDKF